MLDIKLEDQGRVFNITIGHKTQWFEQIPYIMVTELFFDEKREVSGGEVLWDSDMKIQKKEEEIINVPFRKLKRHEIIKEGAMQSWEDGVIQPIKNYDGQIVGSKPSDFLNERDFYNPV